MSKEINAPNGQAAGRDIHNHIQATPCPGPNACQHSRRQVPHSLYSETEFHRLSGFRADAREQELLEAFKQRHRLKWRGSKSIEKMWRHRTLEYDRQVDDLRLTPNLFFHGLGWLHFGLSTLMVLLVLVAIAFGARPTGLMDFSATAASLAVGVIGSWVALDQLIFPESIARRIKNEEMNDSKKQTGS